MASYESEIVSAYIDCALWSTNDQSDESGGEPLDANYGARDLAPEACESMAEDCREFAEANADDLARFCDGLGFGPEQIGHDFWLTRNGHGAGFWDRYYGADDELRAVCRRLTDASKPYGTSDVYVGDDGALYVN